MLEVPSRIFLLHINAYLCSDFISVSCDRLRDAGAPVLWVQRGRGRGRGGGLPLPRARLPRLLPRAHDDGAAALPPRLLQVRVVLHGGGTHGPAHPPPAPAPLTESVMAIHSTNIFSGIKLNTSVCSSVLPL